MLRPAEADYIPAIEVATQPGTRAQAFYEAAGWIRAGTERGEAVYYLTRHPMPRQEPKAPS